MSESDSFLGDSTQIFHQEQKNWQQERFKSILCGWWWGNCGSLNYLVVAKIIFFDWKLARRYQANFRD